MSDRLKGLVASILNHRELVINLGTEDGVLEGMRFAVLNRKGLDVTDPETGKMIGSVEVPKVIVKVVRVQENLSVARTFQKVRKNIGGSWGFNFGGMFEPAKWVEEYESLRLAEKPASEELDEAESYVKVGDPVLQVIGEDFTTEESESPRES